MRDLFVVCGLMLVSVCPVALAQIDEGPDEVSRQEKVIVKGSRRYFDRALDAFRRGDFETAEIEFGKNLQCALRSEAMIEHALDAGQGADFSADSLLEPSSEGFDIAPNAPSTAAIDLATDSSNSSGLRRRTCDAPGFQMYMMGLSKLKLGKMQEAKDILYRAIKRNKGDVMYDAHYRLALLEILDGDIEKAQRRFVQLQKIQKRCAIKKSHCDYGAELDEAVAYLEAKLAN